MAKCFLPNRFINFVRERSGVAAVEFAIGAPMMIFGMLIMTDLGLAIHERMNLDQSVRAGAEFAMHEISDTTDIENLMKGAATGYYSDDQSGWDAQSITPPTVNAAKWCECPETPGASVSCGTTICANDFPPSVYYQLSASKTYKAIILPDFPLNTEIRVQVR